MKTIIFPTDFSKNADKAMIYAVSLAKAMHARIIVVNAFDLPYSQNIMSTSLLDIMRETSENGLKAIAEKLAKTGVEVETRSLMGNPIRVVKDLSKYYENCMVVLGTKGASGLEEVLIGSNAASILHSVNVPVLAIPAQAPYKGVKHILYASDFKSSKNDIALSRLGQIARALNAEVQVLHVSIDSEAAVEPPVEKFEKHLAGVKHTFETIHSNDKNTEEVIIDYAVQHEIDIISLLAKKYGFLEGLFHSSMTSKVAFHTKSPFLALHEQ